MIDNNFDNTTKEVADMETYRIGQIIREERVRKKISQEELSFGICSVATLSRIENGVQKPSLKVEEALLERLGHSTENLVIYADSREIRKHQLEIEIQTKIVHWENIDELLAEYRTAIAVRGTEETLEKQFLQMAEAIGDFYAQRCEWRQIRERLTDALLLTIPNYKEESLEEIKLLTGTELQIINNIALVYAKEEKRFEAIRILEYLVRFLEKGKLDTETPGKYYPMLVYNLVKLLEKDECFLEVKEYTQHGMEYCIKKNRLTCFPELLFYSGIAYQGLGLHEKADKCYHQALSLFDVMGRKDAAVLVRQKLLSLDGTVCKG